MKLIDLSGKKFGRLTVLEKAPSKTKEQCGNANVIVEKLKI